MFLNLVNVSFRPFEPCVLGMSNRVGRPDCFIFPRKELWLICLNPLTAKLFDRDPETNQVLWFAAPPVDAPRHQPPKPSLEYLNFLAKKRKREEQSSGESEAGREKARVPPTVTETMRAMAKEIFAKT